MRQALAQSAGNCRFVFNEFHRLLVQDYEDYKFCTNTVNSFSADMDYKYDGLGYNPYLSLSKMLPALKKKYPFLKLTSSTALQLTAKNIADGVVYYRDSFKLPKSQRKGFVKTKKKSSYNSFSFNMGIKIDEVNSRVYIPLIGYIRYKKSRNILGKPFNVTISKSGDKWFVTIQTKRPMSQVNPKDLNLDEEFLGIDLGIKKIIAMTKDIEFEYNGNIINTKNIQHLDIYQDAYKVLAKLQKQLSKKVKYSQNYIKCKKKVTRQNKHIANIRSDFLHKLSTAIVKQYPNIAVEDLKIKNMSKSAKGTVVKPGKRVKQKKGLNRSILRQGWGMLNMFLAYKLKYMYGTELIKINPKNTSRKCSKCGHIDKHNRKSQAEFVCLSCHFEINADDNAAINISAAGQAAYDCRIKSGLHKCKNTTLGNDAVTTLNSSIIT